MQEIEQQRVFDGFEFEQRDSNQTYEIINPNEDKGIIRWQRIAERLGDGDISEQAFESGKEELLGLAGYFHDLFGGIEFSQERENEYDEEVENRIIERLIVGVEDLDVKEAKELLRETTFVKDTVRLVRELREYIDDEDRIEREARWIFDSETGDLNKYIGPDGHRLLAKTRLLGLIPFETINKLRDLKIRCLGSSVAASTIEMLASLGAEDITFVDGGNLDPSNMSRMPGGVSDFRNSGESKSESLVRALYVRNPYGKFRGVNGKVVMEGQEREIGDMDFDELVGDADLVIEVVDNPWIKVMTRELMSRDYPNTPILFLGDVGSDPFAGLELPVNNNPFNQNLSDEERKRMLGIPTASNPMRESMRAVYKMVSGDFPCDATLQFLAARQGIIPFWAQTPISSRESASIGAKLVIQYLQGVDVSGENIHPDESPTSLNEGLNYRQRRLIYDIRDQVFDL